MQYTCSLARWNESTTSDSLKKIVGPIFPHISFYFVSITDRASDPTVDTDHQALHRGDR